MQVNNKTISDTLSELTISADANDLAVIKQHVIEKLAPKVKMSGFREGKVPVALAEKRLDANTLQNEVLEDAINQFYARTITNSRIKAVAPPKVAVKKYVPYSELVFTAEVEVVGPISLPAYRNLKVEKPAVKITAADINEVLARLQKQVANYKEVQRAAKVGDRIWIDFEGEDAKGHAVDGTKGKDYPLFIGSNAFIPGFEDNLVGLKKGDNKAFSVIFPKDYQLKAMQSKKVIFKVKVSKLEEMTADEISDTMAAKVGPFKTLEDLKKDIRQELIKERERQAQLEFENRIIKEIVSQTQLTLPESMLKQQIDAVDKEFRQNLTYRNETFQGYLTNNALNEAEYREKELKPAAEMRLKAGLVLNEISELENISITNEEIDIRTQILKGQYESNPAIGQDLDKPEARRDIASRILTEKTMAKLVSYCQKPAEATD